MIFGSFASCEPVSDMRKCTSHQARVSPWSVIYWNQIIKWKVLLLTTWWKRPVHLHMFSVRNERFSKHPGERVGTSFFPLVDKAQKVFKKRLNERFSEHPGEHLILSLHDAGSFGHQRGCTQKVYKNSCSQADVFVLICILSICFIKVFGPWILMMGAAICFSLGFRCGFLLRRTTRIWSWVAQIWTLRFRHSWTALLHQRLATRARACVPYLFPMRRKRRIVEPLLPQRFPDVCFVEKSVENVEA